MRLKSSALVVLAVLVMGGALVVAPSTSEAVNITNVVVTTTDGSTFSGCVTAAVCTNKIWDLGATGINLSSPGQTLVLTQNQAGLASGIAAYNFDTSDHGRGPATITINANPTIVDPTGILNFGGVDDDSQTTNEARNWSTSIGGVAASYQVQVGYADSLHLNACADAGDTNCYPNGGPNGGPWQGTATFFLGNGSGLPIAGYPQSTHCSFAAATCFDAGAILITALLAGKVPGPATLLLLGSGLLGLALYRGRFVKKSA